MGGHPGKQCVYPTQKLYPTQKQSRDTHSERKGMDTLSNKEEHSMSETRQRHTPERCAAVLSEKERSREVTCPGQSFRVLVSLWPVILFLCSHLVQGPAPRCVHSFLLR